MLPRYEIFPKLIHSFIQTLQVLKNCKANGLIFADFFVFLNFLRRFRFDLSGIFTQLVGLREPTFLKISGKSGFLGGFSSFSTPAPHVIEIGSQNSQRTIYATLITCLGEKRILKKFPLVPEMWRFLARETGFLSHGPRCQMHSL